MSNIETKIYKVSQKNPDREVIKEAAGILISGGTVVFPTETVYGLGADGTSENAIKKIFSAKNRPADNPLILHIARFSDLFKFCKTGGIKREIYKLIENFWPGPLTLILKRSKLVTPVVSAGLDTVAIRMPSHPVALSLINEAGVPIAAPSANISGKPSPTRGDHVVKDLWGRVSVIIDAGPTGVGVESTVLDMSDDVKSFRVLRPGGITPEELKEVLGEKVEFINQSKKKLQLHLHLD